MNCGYKENFAKDSVNAHTNHFKAPFRRLAQDKTVEKLN